MGADVWMSLQERGGKSRRQCAHPAWRRYPQCPHSMEPSGMTAGTVHGADGDHNGVGAVVVQVMVDGGALMLPRLEMSTVVGWCASVKSLGTLPQ